MSTVDRTWDDIAVVAEPPADGTEAPDSGLGALVTWLVGPDHVIRVPASAVEVPVTRYSVERSGRPSENFRRPRTAAEQDELDEEFDEYLAEAGVRPRPRGYRWFALGPADRVRGLMDQIQRVIDAEQLMGTPEDVRLVGERLLASES